MNEIKALEKLRNALKDCTNKAGVEPNEFDTYWITSSACDNLIDEIEVEIAERYMPLPVDADGVPIHMGDAVEGELFFDNATVRGTVCAYHIHDDDEPGTVYIRVKPTKDTWTIKELQFKRCRHVKPRTLEDVLNDCADEISEKRGIAPELNRDTPTRNEIVAKYADEIRELIGGAE